jgi:hypothetical protein
MTGLECLREEIMKRGCSRTQAEAKVVQVVLEILAQDDTHTYTDLEEAERKLERVKTELDWANRELKRIQPLLKDATDKEKEMRVEHDIRVECKLKQLEEERAEVKEFEGTLMRCETPEGRDAVRCARLFMANTRVSTPQNNTAFISGLAQVLARQERKDGNGETD